MDIAVDFTKLANTLNKISWKIMKNYDDYAEMCGNRWPLGTKIQIYEIAQAEKNY